MLRRSLLTSLFGLVCSPLVAFASSELFVIPGSITFTPASPLVGNNVRVYATIHNTGDDTHAIVRARAGRKALGADQPVTLVRGAETKVFFDWGNVTYGEQTVSVQVVPWNDARGAVGSATTGQVFVDRDSDNDSLPDRQDPDDDNDGYCDTAPATPTCRLNDDNTPDVFPLDPKEWHDLDHDKIGDNSDQDNDNDGLDNAHEQALGTDPLKADSDGDGRNDGQDAFPLDPQESVDTDRDGQGNNTDPDDDNDGVCDTAPALPNICQLNSDETADAFPQDKTEWHDEDHDKLGDNADPDTRRGPIIKYNVPTSALTSETITLSSAGSYDPDGRITDFIWKIDQTELTGSEVYYTFDHSGESQITLTLRDDQGRERSTKIALPVYYNYRRLLTYLLIYVLLGYVGYLNRSRLFSLAWWREFIRRFIYRRK